MAGDDIHPRLWGEAAAEDVQVDDLLTDVPVAPATTPAALVPTMWRPGQSGNPHGRGLGRTLAAPIRKRFRHAFKGVDPRTEADLADTVMRMAAGTDIIEQCAAIVRRCDFSDPDARMAAAALLSKALSDNRGIQLKAIEFVWREGFGKTPTSDHQVKRTAEKLLEAMIEKAEADRAKGTPE